MELRFRFFVSLLIIFAFSSLLGILGSTSHAVYQEQRYRPRWERASLISPEVPAPIAYYRYEFNLDATPIRAYLRLAAPDFLELYVNGTSLGKSAYTSVMASGLFDLTGHLNAGTNAICVNVARKTYPGPASLIGEGAWQSTGGRSGTIATDATWQASIREERQVGGTVPWTALEFNDRHWPRVVIEAARSAPMAAPLEVPADFLRDFPYGQWIWLRDLAAENGTFRRILNVGRPVTGAWIGITTSASYSLSVNDIVVATGNPTREYMDTYNFAPYLQMGHNIIDINLANKEPNGRISIAGMMVDGRKLDFSSNKRWMVKVDEADGAGIAGWTPARVLGDIEPVPMREQLKDQTESRGVPTIRMVEGTPATIVPVKQHTLWILGVLATNALVAAIFHLLYKRRWMGAGLVDSLDVYTKPQIAGILCLLAVFLPQYDVRFDTDEWMKPKVFHWIWTLVALWEIFILAETYLRTAPPRWRRKGKARRTEYRY